MAEPLDLVPVGRLGPLVQHRLARWSTDRAYLNFAETQKAGTAIFGTDTYRRLQQVKLAYDPEDIMRSNHPVQLPQT